MRKRLPENRALAQLQRIKSAYQRFIRINYEHAARDCKTCPTQGVCCTDAHFVNVQITRLEAVAIQKTLERTPRLTADDREKVYARADQAVTQYRLRESGLKQTYSCPLFDKRVGCLVHNRAKPGACIQHACYENWQDLPPQNLQTRTEHRVEQLNRSVYGDDWSWLPIPVWLSLLEQQDRRGTETRRTHREKKRVR